MRYVSSDVRNNYYADFNKMVLCVTDKVSRSSSLVKIQFNETDTKFEGKGVPEQILFYLLPVYQRSLSQTLNQETLKIIHSFKHDLNDLACRDFNSFGSPKK